MTKKKKSQNTRILFAVAISERNIQERKAGGSRGCSTHDNKFLKGHGYELLYCISIRFVACCSPV